MSFVPKPYTTMELVPIGTDAQNVRAGDLILCHRKGFASWCIRTGEWIKYRKGAVVSHAAFVETSSMPTYGNVAPPMLIEALTRGVVRTPLSDYRHIEYWIVRTHLQADDQLQAVRFAQSCIGQKYGFSTDVGLAVRFLTPGDGSFGLLSDGTKICSGFCAQTQVRGWTIYPFEPSDCAPTQLFNFYADAA
jgi:hypothetical protein